MNLLLWCSQEVQVQQVFLPFRNRNTNTCSPDLIKNQSAINFDVNPKP